MVDLVHDRAFCFLTKNSADTFAIFKVTLVLEYDSVVHFDWKQKMPQIEFSTNYRNTLIVQSGAS